MFRRWAMIGSSVMFGVTCAAMVGSFFWRPAIGRIATRHSQPDGLVVWKESSGAALVNACITIVRKRFYQEDLRSPASSPASPSPPTEVTTWTTRPQFQTYDDHWSWFGSPWWFVSDGWNNSTIYTLDKLSIPLWPAALLFGVLPAIHLVRWHRRRRARRADRSVCQACGYDLRATPEGCPECGTVPAGGARIAR